MVTPINIKPQHLERLAICYGRQSSMEQVEKHTGSSAYQREQVRFPREWGWAPGRIQWLEDPGLSGTAAEHRPQYQKLRELICEGKVGLVCVADHSRLGRDAKEWLSFMADCLAHD